jgi:hypothetical protein
VNRLTMLVTPDGRWVLPNTEEFLAVLGDAAPDYDAISFAVKNLGFIKLQIIEQSIIEIELHPRNVELPALLAAQQQLLSARIKLFRIRFFDTAWHSEISSSAEHAISRLSALCAPVYNPPRSERFLVEPRDYTALFDDEENPMRPLVQKWRISFGHFDPNFISLTLKQGLLPRLMIIGVRPRDPDPVFRFIGEGHRWLASDYQVNGIGEHVENQPDKEYGAWVSEFYKSVASTGQPRYDLVSATIQTQKDTPYVARYERLLLPWKTPSEEVFVTLTSKIVEPDLAWESSWAAGDNSFARKMARSS